MVVFETGFVLMGVRMSIIRVFVFVLMFSVFVVVAGVRVVVGFVVVGVLMFVGFGMSAGFAHGSPSSPGAG